MIYFHDNFQIKRQASDWVKTFHWDQNLRMYFLTELHLILVSMENFLPFKKAKIRMGLKLEDSIYNSNNSIHTITLQKSGFFKNNKIRSRQIVYLSP